MNTIEKSPATDPFSTFQQYLAGNIDPSELSEAIHLPDPHRRLIDALVGVEQDRACGAMDIAGLLRHILRSESVRAGLPKTLRVPTVDWVPDQTELASAGMHIATSQGDLLLTALEWRPDWLAGADEICPETATFGALTAPSRRRNDPVTSDGFVADLFGFSTYVTLAQRQAVRSAVGMAPGNTLLVNLPTGSGKSLVEAAGSFLQARDAGGVSIVIVPTISLAQDQERALLEAKGSLNLPDVLAYHGSQPDAVKKVIREKIRDGSQSIVFTSPESLLGSLLPSVFVAARRGFLRYFVIDEAHTIASWGTEFRPEFQSIAGLRLGLLDACEDKGHEPFRTLLMSATLSPETVELLRGLYGTPGSFDSVDDPVLRPEPEFWVSEAEGREDQREKVMEALANLPRPIVVYSTLPEESLTLSRMAADRGYRRTGVVTGGTPAPARAEVMAGWRGQSVDADGGRTSIDIVFATSAFGLGVDYTGVRSVVHACVPETLDRFYQEVGRGGRDGLASLSLSIHCEEDRKVAANLNKNILIGPVLGKERWETLLATSKEVTSHPHRIGVDLRSVRSGLKMNSHENEQWNLRTLLLMSRAGLVMLDAKPPPDQAPISEATADNASDFDAYFSEQVLRILDPHHLELDVWQKRVAGVREHCKALDSKQLTLMKSALQGKEDFADLFALAYRRGGLPVQRSCGGCPDCRAQGREPYAGMSTFPRPIEIEVRVDDTLDRLTVRGETMFLTHSDVGVGKERERWMRNVLEPAIRRLVTHGVAMVRADEQVLSRKKIRSIHEHSPHRFVFSQNLSDDPSIVEVPTVVIEELTSVPPERLSSASVGKPDYPLYVIVHAEQRDPDKPAKRLGETREHVIPLDEFMKGL